MIRHESPIFMALYCPVRITIPFDLLFVPPRMQRVPSEPSSHAPLRMNNAIRPPDAYKAESSRSSSPQSIYTVPAMLNSRICPSTSSTRASRSPLAY